MNVKVNLWNMTIVCALRWGVASVENILYWALWENISGTVCTPVDDAHSRLLLRRRPTCDFDKSFCKNFGVI